MPHGIKGTIRCENKLRDIHGLLFAYKQNNITRINVHNPSFFHPKMYMLMLLGWGCVFSYSVGYILRQRWSCSSSTYFIKFNFCCLIWNVLLAPVVCLCAARLLRQCAVSMWKLTCIVCPHASLSYAIQAAIYFIWYHVNVKLFSWSPICPNNLLL